MTPVDRWVVYSTFDAEGTAAPFAEAQLEAYRDLGFRTLVVDTSPTMSERRAAGWERSSTAWQRRVNAGYDFGSYAHGLRVLLNEFNVPVSGLVLLLTNDSCYGPYTPLGEVFRRFDAEPLDGEKVFGMTDSIELTHHLQSYWLYFRTDVVQHAVEFFSDVGRIENRQDAVELGEIGMSRHLRARGCTLVAFRSHDEVVRHFSEFNGRILSFIELALRWRLNRPRYTRLGDKACLNALRKRPFVCNPSIAFGTHLHLQAMLPFLKRQLVRENPNHDPLIPPFPPSDPRDNRSVDLWLRSSDACRHRYG